MTIRKGTIFKWFNSDTMSEECETGQCVGIVRKVTDPDETSVWGEPTVMVKFWEKCALHEHIDPNGEGPYTLDYLLEIGQFGDNYTSR